MLNSPARKKIVKYYWVLISNALINSYIISHDKFVSINNLLREYNEMKKEIKNSETSMEYTI